MSSIKKVLESVLRGTSDANIPFTSICLLLERLGFKKRVNGSHYIFFQQGIEEIINIQSQHGKAKPYQVKQVRNLILKYKLGGHI